MKELSATEFGRKLETEFFGPLKVFSTSAGSFFGSLEDAREWFLHNQSRVLGPIHNSVEVYARTKDGWVVIAVEVNCISALRDQPGIEELLRREDVAKKLGRAPVLQLVLDTLSNSPVHPQTQVIWNTETDSDFSTLQAAVARVPPREPHLARTFCGGDQGWVVLDTLPYMRQYVRSLLEQQSLQCMSWVAAREVLETSDE